MSKKLKVLDYDSLEYNSALSIQKDIRENILIKEEDNTILLLEHPHTITFGLRANNENLLIRENECIQKNITLVKTDRGGDITYHGPGQLIIYPIINLKDFNLTILSYIELLEQTIISTLKKYNINAGTNTKNRGVWVNDNKIASIGINVKKYITLHGSALNVNTDLKYFDLINPCGLKTKTTSMQKETGRQIEISEVKKTWLSIFKQYTNADILTKERII